MAFPLVRDELRGPAAAPHRLLEVDRLLIRHRLVGGTVEEEDRSAHLFHVRDGGALPPERACLREPADQALLVMPLEAVGAHDRVVDLREREERDPRGPEIGLLR